MPNCIYCGRSAGFFKHQHPECFKHFQTGWSMILMKVHDAVVNEHDLSALRSELAEIAQRHYIPVNQLRPALTQAFEAAVAKFLDDGLLSECEEARLLRFTKHFQLSQEELDCNGAYMTLGKAAVLRDLMNGIVRDRFKVDGTIPFQLQKNEKLIWAFPNVNYYTERTRTHYQGNSAGVSIRIAKGVYYRVGGFRGETIRTSYTSHEATGALGVTTKHVYFASGSNALRIELLGRFRTVELLK